MSMTGIVGARCCVEIASELILMSMYSTAEQLSIATDCRMFQPRTQVFVN